MKIKNKSLSPVIKKIIGGMSKLKLKIIINTLRNNIMTIKNIFKIKVFKEVLLHSKDSRLNLLILRNKLILKDNIKRQHRLINSTITKLNKCFITTEAQKEQYRIQKFQAINIITNKCLTKSLNKIFLNMCQNIKNFDKIWKKNQTKCFLFLFKLLSVRRRHLRVKDQH
jgi:hypothetical protein